MLKRIRLRDFKGFVDEEVELSPLTLLVGANASGKSNFLDALWFLRGLTLGLPLDQVLDGEDPTHGNGEPWSGLRGGSGEASRAETGQFEIETVWSSRPNGADPDEVRYSIICRTSPEPYLLGEQWGLREHLPDPDRSSEDSSFTILGELNGNSPMELIAISKLLGTIQFVNPQPERMRAYGKLKRAHLGADGANFSGALYHLCKDPKERQTVVDWLAELLAPEIVEIEFIEVEELNDVMAVFVEKDGTRVTARSLSDGTLRFLGLLLCLLQAHQSGRGTVLTRTPQPMWRTTRTILIEEVDSGLHPARIHKLMEFLRQITHDRGLQIIATTHAPSCLESLDEETLASTIVFGRVPEKEGSILRRLGDLPHFCDVVKKRGIGELFTTGWLEMAL